MFKKELWIAGLIGGGSGLLIFELCDLWLPQNPLISRIVGVGIFAVVLVILVVVASRRIARKNAEG
ncbi:MAG: hypothetical protein ACYSUM_09500 [Planctomycetota bacterium]|jgi:hypothetical protein